MISEVDLKDWDKGTPTTLYKLPRDTYISWCDSIFLFRHIDGMYSYCEEINGRVVHIGASALVTPLYKKQNG